MKDSMRVAALGLFAALGATCGILVALELNDDSQFFGPPAAAELSVQAEHPLLPSSDAVPSEPPPPFIDAPREPFAIADTPHQPPRDPGYDDEGADRWQSSIEPQHAAMSEVASVAQYVADAPHHAGSTRDSEFAQPQGAPAVEDGSSVPAEQAPAHEVPPPLWNECPDELPGAAPPTLNTCEDACLVEPPLQEPPLQETRNDDSHAGHANDSAWEPDDTTANRDAPVDGGTEHSGGEVDAGANNDDNMSCDSGKHDTEADAFDVPAENAPTQVVRNPVTSEPIASIRLGGEVCATLPLPVVPATAPSDVRRVGHQTDSPAEPAPQADMSRVEPPAADTAFAHAAPVTNATPVNSETPGELAPGEKAPEEKEPGEKALGSEEESPGHLRARPEVPRSAEEVIAGAQDSVFAEAVALMEAGQPEVALELLKAAQRSHARRAIYYELVGETLVRMGKWKSAARVLAVSLRFDKGSARANYLMGIVLVRLDQQNRGQHYLLQAHDLDRRYPLNPWAAR